jgi:hypothetical protein
MVLSAATAAAWLAAGDDAGYPLGLEPMFPALAVAVATWGWGLVRKGVISDQ